MFSCACDQSALLVQLRPATGFESGEALTVEVGGGGNQGFDYYATDILLVVRAQPTQVILPTPQTCTFYRTDLYFRRMDAFLTSQCASHSRASYLGN